MKSLSLPKPLIIIMVGLPGAGKSFFAEQFSETFGAPIVSSDRLYHELFEHPTYSKEERDIIRRVAYYQLEEIFKTKHVCIVDGLGTARVERIELTKAARQAGYETLIVWVQTDEATAKQRTTKPGKHKSKYTRLLTNEQYDAEARRLTPPHQTEAYLVISGKHTYSTQAKVLLKRMTQSRTTEAQLAHVERQTPSLKRRNVIIR